VYGGLKRLQHWNEALIQIVTTATVDSTTADTTTTTTTTMPAELLAWSHSLCASLTTVGSVVSSLLSLPVWHGSVLIYGSEVRCSFVAVAVLLPS